MFKAHYFLDLIISKIKNFHTKSLLACRFIPSSSWRSRKHGVARYRLRTRSGSGAGGVILTSWPSRLGPPLVTALPVSSHQHEQTCQKHLARGKTDAAAGRTGTLQWPRRLIPIPATALPARDSFNKSGRSQRLKLSSAIMGYFCFSSGGVTLAEC